MSWAQFSALHKPVRQKGICLSMQCSYYGGRRIRSNNRNNTVSRHITRLSLVKGENILDHIKTMLSINWRFPLSKSSDKNLKSLCWFCPLKPAFAVAQKAATLELRHAPAHALKTFLGSTKMARWIKHACCQVWLSEYNPWNPQNGRREPITKNYPLPATCAPWQSTH